MSKSSYLECDDVLQSAIGDAAQDVGWVQQEFLGVDLSDKRLDRRLIKTAEFLAQSPLSPINEACGDWACTRAAYRLFNNAKVTPKAILKPHTNETVKRMVAYGGPVLVMQDTVFISYGKHPGTRGLGPIGKSNNSNERGLIMHNGLAFTTSGVALGILSQRIWARKGVPDETKAKKLKRVSSTSIDEKESVKWLNALRDTVDRTPPGVKVITIADRESDFFEFIAEAEERHALFLIRARVDRQLVLEDSEGCASILEAIVASPLIGTLDVDIPSNGKRKARTATVEVRTTQVTIKPPQKTGKAKDSASIEPMTINIVAATEANPPEGIEAISWVLLTNLPIKGFDGAAEKIAWYGKRWGIETWHKILKSGCKVEDCLLETAERLKRFLALFSIIGFRLMQVTYLARVNPDAPSAEAFSKEEIEALHIRLTKALPSVDKPPTIRETVRMIGKLGGHLGRKCDGEPGITVMWRGMMRLYEDVEMLRAHRVFLGLRGSS